MNNYQKLLNNLGSKPAPEDLYKGVLLRLTIEQGRAVKRRFAIAAASLVASVTAAVVAVLALASSLTASGFWKFISLIFTDGGTVVTYWQQFSLSLLESFSMTEMVVSLACIFAVILSIRFMLKNRSAFSSRNWPMLNPSF